MCVCVCVCVCACFVCLCMFVCVYVCVCTFVVPSARHSRQQEHSRRWTMSGLPLLPLHTLRQGVVVALRRSRAAERRLGPRPSRSCSCPTCTCAPRPRAGRPRRTGYGRLATRTAQSQRTHPVLCSLCQRP